jgi:hypothetical protein
MAFRRHLRDGNRSHLLVAFVMLVPTQKLDANSDQKQFAKPHYINNLHRLSRTASAKQSLNGIHRTRVARIILNI